MAVAYNKAVFVAAGLTIGFADTGVLQCMQIGAGRRGDLGECLRRLVAIVVHQSHCERLVSTIYQLFNSSLDLEISYTYRAVLLGSNANNGTERLGARRE